MHSIYDSQNKLTYILEPMDQHHQNCLDSQDHYLQPFHYIRRTMIVGNLDCPIEDSQAVDQ